MPCISKSDLRVEEFLSSFLETALWSSGDDGEFDELDTRDIDADARETLETLAHAFVVKMYPYLDAIDAAGDAPTSSCGSGCYAMAGHDAWLTANGHGAGFWDGDWPETYSDMLTKCATATIGHVDLYVGDDGKVYC